MAKDAFGNEICAGDKIFYSVSVNGNGTTYTIGEVVDFHLYSHNPSNLSMLGKI